MQLPDGRQDNLKGVWGTSPDNVYAVGSGAGGATIYRFDGTTWRHFQTATDLVQFRSIWGTAPDNFYVVGNRRVTEEPVGRIYHWDGKKFTIMVSTKWDGQGFDEVWGTSPSDVFVVGDNDRVLHSSGDGSWQEQHYDKMASHLFDVGGNSPTDVYATGYRKLMHYDGTSWSDIPLPTGEDGGFSDILGFPSGVTLFAGNRLYSRIGDIWHPYEIDLPPYTVLENLWGSSPDSVYAVFNSGRPRLLGFFNGIEWTTQEPDITWSSSNGGFDAVWGTGNGQVFFVGSWGTIVRLSQEVAPPTPPTSAPVRHGPQGGTDDRTPTFSWDAVDGASWYHVWVQKDGVKYREKWVQYTTWTPTESFASGSYQWWIAGYNDAGYGPWTTTPMSFSVAFNPPGRVVLTAPTDRAKLTDGSASFAWSVADPAATWYRLWISRNGKKYADLWLTQRSWSPEGGLRDGDYAWAVQTYNDDGYGPWSSPRYLSVEIPTPGRVSLQAPGDGVTLAERKPLLSWTAATPPATWYRVWINRNGTSYRAFWTDDRSWRSEQSMSLGDYRWWVRTWASGKYGRWSVGRDFSIRKQLPAAAQLLTPADKEVVDRSNPRSSWESGVPAATWYRLWIERNGVPYVDTWTQETSWRSVLLGGSYTWWIQTWNPSGYGPWSKGRNFIWMGTGIY